MEQFKQITPYESYHEAKGQLWQTYMSAITPKLKEFQKTIRENCEKLNSKPTKANQTKCGKVNKAALMKYLQFCEEEFQTYITDLQIAYIEDQYRIINLSCSPVFAKTTATKAKKKRKPSKKAIAAESKPSKKAAKRKPLKASKKYTDHMKKKFNVKS
jgi:hypothetical protein